MKIFLFSFQGALFASKYIIRGGNRMKKELSVKTIVAIGIGSAVFVILGRFAVIPIFTNTNLETS